jgi:hypothetical protein
MQLFDMEWCAHRWCSICLLDKGFDTGRGCYFVCLFYLKLVASKLFIWKFFIVVISYLKKLGVRQAFQVGLRYQRERQGCLEL